jgi:hypothetical protein
MFFFPEDADALACFCQLSIPNAFAILHHM